MPSAALHQCCCVLVVHAQVAGLLPTTHTLSSDPGAPALGMHEVPDRLLCAAVACANLWPQPAWFLRAAAASDAAGVPVCGEARQGLCKELEGEAEHESSC
jgi:hypothetical protein